MAMNAYDDRIARRMRVASERMIPVGVPPEIEKGWYLEWVKHGSARFKYDEWLQKKIPYDEIIWDDYQGESFATLYYREAIDAVAFKLTWL